MTRPNRYNLALAIYLTAHGFAFALFEGPLAPVDWGIVRRDGAEKNRRCLKAIAALLQRHRPDVLILQDTSWTGTTRPQRITNHNAAIFKIAENCAISVCAFSGDQVCAAFSSVQPLTKHAIAEAIVKHIPAFESFLPEPRKWWNSADPRMGLFDAAALVLTFFHSLQGGGQQSV
jgi:hypothetical protein